MRSKIEMLTVVCAQPDGTETVADGPVGSARPGSVGGAVGPAQADRVISTFNWCRSRTQQLCATPFVAGGHAFAGAGAQPASRNAPVYAAAVSFTDRVDCVVRSLFMHDDRQKRLPLV